MTNSEHGALRADARRNRQRLLDAAREVFAAQGLDVTLDEIARHAGVGTGTAYRRFANKHVLIEELMVDRLGDVEKIVRECLEERDAWLGLSGFFERTLAMMASDRGLRDVMFSAGRGGERLAEARQNVARMTAKLLRRSVEAGVVRSDLAPTDLALINLMLNTLIDFGRDVEPELYRRFLAITLDGLRPQRDGAAPLPVAPLDLPRFAQVLADRRR
jgi:AcrR family transcriptional regulator